MAEIATEKGNTATKARKKNLATLSRVRKELAQVYADMEGAEEMGYYRARCYVLKSIAEVIGMAKSLDIDERILQLEKWREEREQGK